MKGTTMNQQIFVTLAVDDLAKSTAFFTALGFGIDPRFSGEGATSIVIAEGRFNAMLASRDMFQTLTNKTIVDARTSTEVLFCLTCDSREEMDALVAKAVAAGGREAHPPEDHGFMVSWGFEDLDGHNWGLAWMKDAP
jgi:predicted lactoylglutathione lyase